MSQPKKKNINKYHLNDWYKKKGIWRGGNRAKNYNNRRSSSKEDFGDSERNASIENIFPKIVPEYKYWNTYLPKEPFHKDSPVVHKVKSFHKYLMKIVDSYEKNEIIKTKSFKVDFKDLSIDHDVQGQFESITEALIETPDFFINSLSLCMHNILEDDSTDENSNLSFKDMIYCRIINFSSVTPLRDLRASYYEKFVCVRGTTVRVSNIYPGCVEFCFECSTCGTKQVCLQYDQKYTVPKKCLDSECKGKVFSPMRSDSSTTTIDCQSIRLQELLEDDRRETGAVPRIIECELTNDLADGCVPGDIVTICGIVKMTSGDEFQRSDKDRSMFLLYIQANSLVTNKSYSSHNLESEYSVDFGLVSNISDLSLIQEIQAKSNLFRVLVQSLCPGIYGHEMVKAGLILGLFGGSAKYTDSKNCVPVRGDIHTLVVGDPGLGKSQMLQACANAAPRGVFVCGNSTTTSGLTVTLTKEAGSNEYSLEAGALVLADHGCCCIDEFDKMGHQHQALLEAMEQQSISVAKAGIVCSLPARTSILAAANPSGGSYNKAKSVSENLKMSGAVLSRFDLVFILIDNSNEEYDCMLSEHVMSIHSSKKRIKKNLSLIPASAIPSSYNPSNEFRLKEKLKYHSEDSYETLPHFLFRKYIAYARQYVNPKLSPSAATLLQRFYIELRKKHQTHDSTPVTTRQLESMIRLAEARAKLELREIVSIEDAEDVIDLMKFSMRDTCTDEHGNLDFSRSQHGSGMSRQSQIKKFIAVLNTASERLESKIFTIKQMKDIIKENQLKVKDFDNLLFKLNMHGYLLKKGSQKYLLQT